MGKFWTQLEGTVVFKSRWLAFFCWHNVQHITYHDVTVTDLSPIDPIVWKAKLSVSCIYLIHLRLQSWKKPVRHSEFTQRRSNLHSCNRAILDLIPRPSSIEASGKNVTGGKNSCWVVSFFPMFVWVNDEWHRIHLVFLWVNIRILSLIQMLPLFFQVFNCFETA